MSAEELYKKIKEWVGKKQELPDIFSLMNLWFRDILVIKSTNGAGRLVFREEETELMRQAELLSYHSLDHCFEAIETTKQRMNANVNLEVSLELLLYEIKERIIN